MRIPTTDRKYYDTEKKINTLGAYASELLPAAKDLQAEIKEQQSIKMDKLGIEARMRMNDATNEWRLANQSNPNDPNALQDLQNQYDSILSDYRNEIDPLYRSQWDITGNKLKGAFDLENQAWGFKQRQENAKNDMADSMESYLKLAYSYGQSGSLDKALVDFQQSYDKLLDYGAKNLGTEDAAVALKNYQKDFYISYLDGLVEKNPSQALKMLNSKEFYGILDSRDFKRFKNYAKARQKEIHSEVFNSDFQKYASNPTEEGKLELLKRYPNMSKKTINKVDDVLNTAIEYEAKTTYTGYEEAINELGNLTNEDDDEIRNSNVLEFLAKVNKSKNIGVQEKEKLKNNAIAIITDKEKRDMMRFSISDIKELEGWNLKKVIGNEASYYESRIARRDFEESSIGKMVGATVGRYLPERFKQAKETEEREFPTPTTINTGNRFLPMPVDKTRDMLMKEGMDTVFGYWAKGDDEGMKIAKKEYKRRMLEYLNPEIKGKKEGDIVEINGALYRIESIGDDVILNSN